MSEVKRRKISIRSLPFDCLLHVLLFIQKPRGLENLVLTFRGFQEHVRLFPKSCRFIEYSPKYIPNSSPVPYVCKVVHGTFLPPNTALGVYCPLGNEPIDVLSNCFQAFPNLMFLELILVQQLKKVEEVRNHETMEVRETTEDNLWCVWWNQNLQLDKVIDIPCSLVSLDLTLNYVDISLIDDVVYPKLKILRLASVNCNTNFGNYQLLPRTRRKSNLVIKWKCLPALQDLEMCCWTLQMKDFDGLLESWLRVLRIIDCPILGERRILPSFENLETLELGGEDTLSSIGCSEPMSNLKALEINDTTLSIETSGKATFTKEMSMNALPFPEGFIVINPSKFPHLQKLHINFTDSHLNPISIDIDNFKELRDICILNASPEFHLRNLPNLVNLILYLAGMIFLCPHTVSKLEKISSYDTIIRLPNNSYDVFSHFKNLEKLEYTVRNRETIALNFSKQHKLKHLVVGSFYRTPNRERFFQNSVMIEGIEDCPNLEYIKAVMSSNSVASGTCEKLQYVTLGNVCDSRILEDWIISSTENLMIGSFDICTPLKMLRLTDCDICRYCKQLTFHNVDKMNCGIGGSVVLRGTTEDAKITGNIEKSYISFTGFSSCILEKLSVFSLHVRRVFINNDENTKIDVRNCHKIKKLIVGIRINSNEYYNRFCSKPNETTLHDLPLFTAVHLYQFSGCNFNIRNVPNLRVLRIRLAENIFTKRGGTERLHSNFEITGANFPHLVTLKIDLPEEYGNFGLEESCRQKKPIFRVHYTLLRNNPLREEFFRIRCLRGLSQIKNIVLRCRVERSYVLVEDMGKAIFRDEIMSTRTHEAKNLKNAIVKKLDAGTIPEYFSPPFVENIEDLNPNVKIVVSHISSGGYSKTFDTRNFKQFLQFSKDGIEVIRKKWDKCLR